MVKLAANLTLMFNERPFLERFDAAADAGFTAVECLAPYDVPAEAIAERLEAPSLSLVLFNVAVGDWAAGDRGFGADPGRAHLFGESLKLGLTYANLTGCRQLHLMAGRLPPDGDRAAWRRQFVENARTAADIAIDDGIEIMLEPINTKVDIPGYFLDSTGIALEILDEIDRPNVRLQYDVYHMQIMEGDIARTIERLLPRIGHIQIADNPGRNEPGTGEINYPWLLSRLDALGYDRWVGCEYRPSGDTRDGLDWAKPYLQETSK